MPEKYTLKQINLNFTIDPNTLRKFWTYCKAIDVEISALAEADLKKEPGSLEIHVNDKLHLLKQKGHVAGTHLDVGSVADLLADMAGLGRNTEKLRVWLHKHPGYGPDSVYFSSTDTATIRDLGQFMPLLVAGVFNSEGYTHWGIFQGERVVTEFDTMIALPEPSDAEVDAVKPQVEKLVKELSFQDHHRSWKPFGFDLWGLL